MRPLCLLALFLLGGRAAAAAGACGLQALTFRGHGSLSASLVGAVGEQGSELSAHLARIFMWDLDLRRDVVGGDEVHLLWRASHSGEMEIAAAAYRSQRLGRLLAAYRFRPAGDQYPSYWDESGVERQRRLQGGPPGRCQGSTALP